MSSDAVGSERVSRIVGYKITKGNFALSSPNLPQRIAIIGEANDDNQATLDTDPYEFTTAQQVGSRYGYGSPLYHVARILRPVSGDGVGGIVTVVYPQAKAVGALPKILRITPIVSGGSASGGGTHIVKVGGRGSVDGQSYAINVAAGDTAADINEKITDALNAVLGCPVTADDYSPSHTICTSKWSGLTANGIQISVDTQGADLGVTYTVSTVQSGSGVPTVSIDFGNTWNTIVVNTYGADDASALTVLTTLEAYNGKPDPTNPTGRFAATIMRPFVAITGSVSDDISATTDARLNDVTVAIAPAPLSEAMHFEAAANMTLLYARVAQDNPHLDVAGKFYPDMPTPDDIGSMATYNNRDAFVKKGLSTVDKVAGQYKVMDFVTTYHPEGELPPQFRYVRSLYSQDLNVFYSYYLLEQINVVDHAIANDNDTVTAGTVIKPKQWVQILGGESFAEDLVKRGVIVDAAFLKSSLVVNISTTNPDRLETFFRYKRSGFARIASTTAQAGFNFGNV